MHLFLTLGALLLVGLTALANTLEDLLAVLVRLELGDDNLAWGDADGDRLAVGLLAGDTLDLDEILEAVDGGDLALTALVGAADDGDFVVLADGDGSDLEGTLEQARSNRSQCMGMDLGICVGSGWTFHTLCFSRSSLERGALMMLRRAVEPALKWALRDLRLEEARPAGLSALYKRSLSCETYRDQPWSCWASVRYCREVWYCKQVVAVCSIVKLPERGTWRPDFE